VAERCFAHWQPDYRYPLVKTGSRLLRRVILTAGHRSGPAHTTWRSWCLNACEERGRMCLV